MEIIGQILFSIFFLMIMILGITLFINLIIINLIEIKKEIKKWKYEEIEGNKND